MQQGVSTYMRTNTTRSTKSTQSVKKTFTFPRGRVERLEALSAQLDMSEAAIVAIALEEYFDRKLNQKQAS